MCSIAALSTVLTCSGSSSAAPIPTPTPGAALTLTAPAPDPAQFDFSAQQTLTHQALNSDVYGAWYEFFSLISALNATGAGAYACGPCVTSTSNGTGVSTTLGTQSSGAGVQLTIGLAHGDYDDLANAQTLSGVKTFSAAPVLSYAGASTCLGTDLSKTPQTATNCVQSVGVSGPLSNAGTASNPVIACASCQTGTRVKLAIGLGFAQGAVATSLVFPTQPAVAYAGGQLTGIRAACGTVDNGTTVVQLSKNGSAIGTLTLGTSTVSSTTITTATIGAGDYLTFAITTAGTAQNCGFVAEGWQNVQ